MFPSHPAGSSEPDKINALLGTDIPSRRDAPHPDSTLGFGVDGDTITVPSWRGDVEHYSDIAEEVARFYGYNKIPTTAHARRDHPAAATRAQQVLEREPGHHVPRAWATSEIITYSFISPTYYDKIRLPEDSPLRKSMKILNPLGEDTSIMRTTVLPSMLEILTRNYNYRNKAVRLYELGRTYFEREDGMAEEPKLLSLGLYGPEEDFFSLKGAVETILESIRAVDVTYEAVHDNPSFHPGRCARVLIQAGSCRHSGADPSAGGSQLRGGYRPVLRRALLRQALRPQRGRSGIRSSAQVPCRDPRHCGPGGPGDHGGRPGGLHP